MLNKYKMSSLADKQAKEAADIKPAKKTGKKSVKAKVEKPKIKLKAKRKR